MSSQLYEVDLLTADGSKITQAGELSYTDGPMRVLGPFSIDHTTANLNTGAVIYTTDTDQYIIGAVIVPVTAWNGTTPKGDVGDASDHKGFYAAAPAATAFDMTTAAGANWIDGGGSGNLWLTGAISVCVSENGAFGGTATGATVGASDIYLIDPCVSRVR